jgi:hypothetical protein
MQFVLSVTFYLGLLISVPSARSRQDAPPKALDLCGRIPSAANLVL